MTHGDKNRAPRSGEGVPRFKPGGWRAIHIALPDVDGG